MGRPGPNRDGLVGRIAGQVRSELKQLPLMLGKLLGGGAAALGSLAAVLDLTRRTDAGAGNIVPPLLFAAAGVAAFVLCDRALARRAAPVTQKDRPADHGRMNLLAWGLLLLLAAVFLAAVELLFR